MQYMNQCLAYIRKKIRKRRKERKGAIEMNKEKGKGEIGVGKGRGGGLKRQRQKGRGYMRNEVGEGCMGKRRKMHGR